MVKRKTAKRKTPRRKTKAPKRKSKARIIAQKRMKPVRQTKHGKAMDKKLKAKIPSRRTSRSGRKYTERRSNRSDPRGSKY